MRLLKEREYGIEVCSWRYLGLKSKSFWREFDGLKASLMVFDTGEVGLRLKVVIIYGRIDSD
jgi:hypothetical protein